MNGLATSCDAEVSKPPANARKSQGTDSRGGLGERDKAPGAIISNNSYINVEPQKQQRRTRPTAAEARRPPAPKRATKSRVTTSPRAAPPAF